MLSQSTKMVARSEEASLPHILAFLDDMAFPESAEPETKAYELHTDHP